MNVEDFEIIHAAISPSSISTTIYHSDNIYDLTFFESSSIFFDKIVKYTKDKDVEHLVNFIDSKDKAKILSNKFGDEYYYAAQKICSKYNLFYAFKLISMLKDIDPRTIYKLASHDFDFDLGGFIYGFHNSNIHANNKFISRIAVLKMIDQNTLVSLDLCKVKISDIEHIALDRSLVNTAKEIEIVEINTNPFVYRNKEEMI